MRYEQGKKYRIVDAESAGIAGCAQNGDVLTADTVEDYGARAFCAGTYFGDFEDLYFGNLTDLKQGWIVPVEDENEPMAEHFDMGGDEENRKLRAENAALAKALRQIRYAHSPTDWAYRVADAALEKHRAESAEEEGPNGQEATQ